MLKKLSSLLLIFVCSISVVVLTACDNKTSSDSPVVEKIEKVEKTTKASESITIIEPLVRPTPPGQKTTAMYMKLKNSSSNKHDLVKVEGNISKMIELHTHTNDNGVMKMGQVESFPVDANSTAEAKPGSYHVMIMNLEKDLVLGDKYDFTLTFKDGSTMPVTAEVKNVSMHQH